MRRGRLRGVRGFYRGRRCLKLRRTSTSALSAPTCPVAQERTVQRWVTASGYLTGFAVNSNIFFNTSPEGSCDGSSNITSLGYNLDSCDNCLGAGGPSDRPFTSPRLFPGPPLDHGGPTPTIALLPNSPAIDAGNPACPPPDTDQRGFVRPQFVGCDSGAFEFEGFAQVANIPTLGEWGMIVMAGVLGIATLLIIRRRKATA